MLWYFARFGPEGGPRTLNIDLAAASDEGRCYEAVSQTDTGETDLEANVVFQLDDRRVRSANGRICLLATRHWHRLRATKRGLVRSRAITPRTRFDAVCCPFRPRLSLRGLR